MMGSIRAIALILVLAPALAAAQPPPTPAQKQAASERVKKAIAKYGSGAYANYADPDLGNPLRNYYGANLPRLRRVKEEFDPANRFRPSQGVK